MQFRRAPRNHHERMPVLGHEGRDPSSGHAAEVEAVEELQDQEPKTQGKAIQRMPLNSRLHGNEEFVFSFERKR